MEPMSLDRFQRIAMRFDVGAARRLLGLIAWMRRVLAERARRRALRAKTAARRADASQHKAWEEAARCRHSCRVRGPGAVDSMDMLIAEDPSQFAEACLRLLADPALGHGLAAAGFKRGREHSTGGRSSPCSTTRSSWHAPTSPTPMLGRHASRLGRPSQVERGRRLRACRRSAARSSSHQSKHAWSGPVSGRSWP
jgi:hypothetical protein